MTAALRALKARLDTAVEGIDAPLAVVDAEAFGENAADLVRRAGGAPIRVATKSVRIRRLIADVARRPGFAGVLGFCLAEAIWLARVDPDTFDDILVGYPSVDRAAFAELGADEQLASAITVTVDDSEQLDLIESVVGRTGPRLRVCVDIDTSLRPLGAWVGARRSGIRTSQQAVDLAREIAGRERFRLVGLLTYEAQIAGVPDTGPLIRVMKSRSITEITARRAQLVAAVREVADLEFVNAGGTGSLEVSGSDPVVTELTAGSGLMGPTLFDRYRGFQPAPAALLAFPVVRRPGPRVVTVYSGGWIASGPTGRGRAPTPYLPAGLRLTGAEGAGEVQTPLLGRAADQLAIGENVWFRHAKSGEPFERLAAAYLVGGGGDVERLPTYRGEGKAFGL